VKVSAQMTARSPDGRAAAGPAVAGPVLADTVLADTVLAESWRRREGVAGCRASPGSGRRGSIPATRRTIPVTGLRRRAALARPGAAAASRVHRGSQPSA